MKYSIKNCVVKKKILHLCCELPELWVFANKNENAKIQKGVNKTEYLYRTHGSMHLIAPVES